MLWRFTGSPWNPRYLAYAAAHGARSPEEMSARDDRRWPGGRNAGFIVWINARWADFRQLIGVGRYEPLDQIEVRWFDLWLITGSVDRLFPTED